MASILLQGIPYGLSSAPAVFHRNLMNIFEGIPGVEVYIDDIIVWGSNEAKQEVRFVWGSNEAEQEVRLKQVLSRARSGNVKFNKKKCKYRVSEGTKTR